MVPPFPPTVRFATPWDLPRLGLVAAAGYADAPQAPYMRPYFATYPQDRVASYYMGYRRDLMNPHNVVIVVEDELDLHEKEKVCEELKGLWPSYSEDDEGKRVVVAVASFAVPQGCDFASKRSGEGYINDGIPEIENPQRDVEPEGMKLLGAVIGPLFKTNLVSKGTINTMVLHPAYNGRRHGDKLVHWINEFFAELDLSYYLAATPGGKKLYLRNGARQVDEVEVPGYSKHPEAFTIWMCQWDPPKREVTPIEM